MLYHFGIIGGFSGWLSGLIGNWNALNWQNLGICDFRAAMDIPDRFNRENGVPIPIDTCEIEFKNVSFGYTSKEKIIRNVNFSIQKGEKIALVGPNQRNVCW